MGCRLAILALSMLMVSALSAQHIRINEFLANNTGDLESEWIELYNSSDYPVNLADFEIGDALVFRSISEDSALLAAGGYCVLAQDSSGFLTNYTDFTGAVIEPASWPILNNSGDVIRLQERGGAMIDSVCYDDVFGDNRSCERFVSIEGVSFWGESYDPSGATPGQPNSYYPNQTTGIDISISPNPFSPDGDGIDDVTCISFSSPADGSITLSLYDISGRKLRVLLDSVDALPGEVIWKGYDDDKRRLAPGIYIVYMKYSGADILEQKTTVVIAR